MWEADVEGETEPLKAIGNQNHGNYVRNRRNEKIIIYGEAEKRTVAHPSGYT